MSNECTHTLASGHKCHAPALDGANLCRHHDPRKRAEAAQESEPFLLPEFHDARGILAAVNAVLRAMSERRIKRSEAGTLLFGLQLASRLLREISESDAQSDQPSVPSMTHHTSPSHSNPSRPPAAPGALSEPARQILKIAAQIGVPEAARQWVEQAREPGDRSPITAEELEEAVEVLTLLQETGDPRQVLNLLDSRIKAYEQNIPTHPGSLPYTHAQAS